MAKPEIGPKIRDLTDAEKMLRAKHVQAVQKAEADFQSALRRLGEAKGWLNDLAMAFNGGEPVVMTGEALHEPVGVPVALAARMNGGDPDA